MILGNIMIFDINITWINNLFLSKFTLGICDTVQNVNYFILPQYFRSFHILTHWGRVTHICVSKLTFISSDNGLSSGQCQAIIWTNAGILLIGPLGTNFSEILIEILTFLLKKMSLKVSSVKWRPFCLGLNVLTHWGRVKHICISKLTIIVPDNGLSPDRSQAIIWNNAGILLIQTSGTNFSEILSEIHIFSFKKMHLKMSSAKWWPFCLVLNVLIWQGQGWSLLTTGQSGNPSGNHLPLERTHQNVLIS